MSKDFIIEIGRIFIVAAATAIVARNSIELSITLLRKAGCVMKNYRGNEVVFGVGIAFLPVLLTMAVLFSVLYINIYSIEAMYLFSVSSISFVGLLDDLIGEKQIKGIRRHVQSFLRGQLTTGFAKAFIGFCTAVIISSSVSQGFSQLILNTLVIALFTNTLNLMDLRPGRCIKIFLLLGAMIFLSTLRTATILMPLLVLIISALIYLRYDLREICMLGDTGSNVLGISLGYFSILVFDTLGKAMLLIILLAINAIAEKYSISKFIAGNRFLSFLDSLGRRGG